MVNQINVYTIKLERTTDWVNVLTTLHMLGGQRLQPWGDEVTSW